MLVILGPTASGKTRLAALTASVLNAEIISADSRQVYRGMDIGTGKDLGDYLVDGKRIPVHLTDIADPGYEYNIFEYKRDFARAYRDITERGKLPLLCGGSGMYLEAVLRNYELAPAGSDPELQTRLDLMADEELRLELAKLRPLHNTTDLTDRNRTIRAILATSAHTKGSLKKGDWPEIRPVIIGVRYDRQELRTRITRRLEQRLEEGMIEEVEKLLDQGIPAERLRFYGLEYRFVTQYLLKEIDHATLFTLLNTAIHQFAKRQMTWYRRMEKNGILIQWIDGETDMTYKVDLVTEIWKGNL